MCSDSNLPPNHQFPNTRWSIVLDAQGSDSAVRNRALEQICQTYWLPVYAFARGQGIQPADAEDLTQNILGQLLNNGGFDKVTEEKGKLRSFLRVATKNYLRNDWKKTSRQKRGGHDSILSLDHEDAEQLCVLDSMSSESPDEIFDRHWGLNLLDRTMDRLGNLYRGEGKGEVFDLLKGVLGRGGGGPRYQDLAKDLSISEGAVKVAVHRLRKRYRRLMKEEITMTLGDESKEAVDEEIRHLFGVLSR